MTYFHVPLNSAGIVDCSAHPDISWLFLGEHVKTFSDAASGFSSLVTAAVDQTVSGRVLPRDLPDSRVGVQTGNVEAHSVCRQADQQVHLRAAPPGVLDELRELNPRTERGWRRHKHHQYLSADTGNSHLDRQISTVTTLMRIADHKCHFEELFDRAFPPAQPKLPLIVELEEDADTEA